MMTDTGAPNDDLIAAAIADRAADIEALADLNEDQLYYLAHAEEIPDPVTDGLGCEAV